MLIIENVIIRKRWLESSFINLLIFPFFAFLFLLGNGLAALPISIIIRIACGSILGGWVSFLLCYFCAYRKIGTKYLTFVLIAEPFSILKDIIQDLSVIGTAWGLIFLVVKLALYVWWYRCTFRLRHFNKKMKLEEVKQIEESVF